MKSHLFVFISLLVFPYSFTKKEVARVNFADIRTELNKISARLNVHTVTETASSSISAFIDSGVKSYNDSPTDDNFKKIIDNFSRFITAVEKYKEQYPSDARRFIITSVSISKARTSLCPLYPFC
jgi:hypothetical protein